MKKWYIDFELLNSFRIPPNEVAASLSIQYRDKLDVSEQAIIVLYNNHKYRKLCNAILSIQDSLFVLTLI